MFTDRELATVLAALRFWQCRGPGTTSWPAIPISSSASCALEDIATDCGRFKNLASAEIDQLCGRLNLRSARPLATLGNLIGRAGTTFGRCLSRCLSRFRGRPNRVLFPAFTAHSLPLQAGHGSLLPFEHLPSEEVCCDCQLPGFFCSGVPGIVAHVENGRLSPTAKVERCDACQRYPSDEAALAKLRELGF